MSLDDSGRLRSPEEQRADNARVAAAQGIALGEPYMEPHAVGASRFSKGKRAEFTRLLEDMESGRFGAEVLILWESSRCTRRLSEWIRLIEACEDQGIMILAGGRMYDPSDGRDRRNLVDDGNDSEYEAYKTSHRTRRAASSNAAAGRPHGTCPYGLRQVYDERTGRLINWEPDPERAPVIKELFTRLTKGHTFKGMARDFAERGIVNKKGAPFTPQHLRDLATRAAYTGLRVHKGEHTEGTWKPIVKREVFWQVQRILSGAKHQPTAQRPGKARHAFTRIMVCDECGAGMTAVFAKGVPQYRCGVNGCVRIHKDDVDEVITAHITTYLASDDAYEKLTRTQAGPEAEDAAAEVARLEAEISEAEAQEPQSVYEARTMARLIEGLHERLAAAQARYRQLTTPSELASLIAPGTDAAQRWKAAPISAQRRAAAILLSPPHLGQVRITRSPVRNHRVQAIRRIKWARS